MFAKIRTASFIDALQLELSSSPGHLLKGVLRDDSGCVCSTLERDIFSEKELLTWSGLNDLPYGKYTLELQQGDTEIRMNLVKRV